MLGPLRVTGAARCFRRAWSAELVTYLALHRRGASTDQWTAALWPDRIMAPATVHSVISDARRALGRGPSGAEHLPRSRGRLRLAPSVVSDWERFGELAALGHDGRWDALALVRGRPFEDLRCPDWPVLEGWTAEIEEAVAAVAEQVGREELARGRPATAVRAARLGLRVAPFEERLFRLLLSATHAVGNRLVLPRLLVELRGRGADGWSGRPRLHPATEALCRRLMLGEGRAGRPGGHPVNG